MTDIIDTIKQIELDSSFLRDILADPTVINPYNVIYNLEPVYKEDSVLIDGLIPSDQRPVTTQIVSDLSESVFEQIGSVVVKDTFPLGSGHVLCVPINSVPSFNQYLNSTNITAEKFSETRMQMAKYIRQKALLSGLESDQVVMFEHGSGSLTNQGEVFNACGTGVELCSTAVHAHLHILPVPNRRIRINDILERIRELAGEDALQIISSIQVVDHSTTDLKGASYFSLKIVDFAGEDEEINMLIVPNEDLFHKVPSQLWRRVLGPLLHPKNIHSDLIDYKKLSNITLGDLRAESVIKELRQVHDQFWLNLES